MEDFGSTVAVLIHHSQIRTRMMADPAQPRRPRKARRSRWQLRAWLAQGLYRLATLVQPGPPIWHRAHQPQPVQIL